ncbi:hypothetical protein LTR39_001279, partial [Cryomyces antarcticus]
MAAADLFSVGHRAQTLIERTEELWEKHQFDSATIQRYDARRVNELRETVDRLIGEKAILEWYVQQQQAWTRNAKRLVGEIEDEESEPSQATVDELREAREALHHLRNICRRILEITRDEYRESEWEGVRRDSADQVPHISAYLEPNDKEELEEMRAVMDDKGSRWSTMDVYRRARDLQLSLQNKKMDAAGFKAEGQRAEAAREKLNHDWMTQSGRKTAAEAGVNRLKRKLDRLGADLDGKDLYIQGLRDQVKSLADEKAVMSEQIKRLEGEKDQAAKNLEDVRQLQGEKSALTTKVQDLTITLQRNIDQVKELQANKTHEIGQRSALVAECERQISTKNAEHEATVQTLMAMQVDSKMKLLATVSTHLGRLLDRELIEQKVITVFLSLLPNTTTTTIDRIWGRISAQYICPPTDQGFDVNFVTVTSSIDWSLSVVDPQKCITYPGLSFRQALKVLWVHVCCVTGPGVVSTLNVLEHMLDVWKVMTDQELRMMLRVSNMAIDNIEKELPDDKETRAMTILVSIRCLEVFARLGLQSTEPNRTRVNCMRKRIEDVMQQNAIKNTLFDALLTWLREAFEVRVSSQPPNLIDLLPLSPRFAGVDGRFLFPDSDSTICLVDPGLKLITRFIKVEEVRCRFTIDGVGVSILSARRMPGGRSVIQSRIWAREGGVPFLYIHLGGVLNETDEEVEAAAAAVFAEAARVEALTKFANRERVGPY